MRLVRFISNAISPHPIYGEVIQGNRVNILEGSEPQQLQPNGRQISFDSIQTFLPPVDPPNIFAIGKNYAAHARELKDEVPVNPLIFMKATTSVIAHNQPILLPPINPDEVDYEAELAVVIGSRPVKNISPAHALEYVGGYFSNRLD